MPPSAEFVGPLQGQPRAGHLISTELQPDLLPAHVHKELFFMSSVVRSAFIDSVIRSLRHLLTCENAVN